MTSGTSYSRRSSRGACIAAVCRAFDFLQYRYGFRIVSQTWQTVRWESKKVFITIRRVTTHDPLKYYLSIDVGERKRPQKIFHLPDFIQRFSSNDFVRNIARSATPRTFPATTEEQCVAAASCLAQLMMKYCVAILEGDIDVFRELRAEQEKRAAIFGNAEFVKEMRSQAEIAFQHCRFSRVVDCYTKIKKEGGRLTPVETKKFEISLRRKK